jgi:hypothetical protein
MHYYQAFIAGVFCSADCSLLAIDFIFLIYILYMVIMVVDRGYNQYYLPGGRFIKICSFMPPQVCFL